MITRHLAVIVSPAPLHEIKEHFKGYTIYTDGDIYEFLNFGSLNGRHFGLDDLEDLCNEFVEIARTQKTVIHSFNPLIQNWLMCYKELQSANDPLEEDLQAASKRFFVWKDDSNHKGFVSLLDLESLPEKLKVLAVGDAVCDCYLEELISQHKV